METTLITLRCWIYRDDIRRIFPVEVLKNRSVEDLKEVVKEKSPGFHDVATEDLRLYSIFIPVGGEDELKQLSLKDKSCLEPQATVSELFPESDKGEEGWLIVVDGHNSDIILNYWVWGENMNSIYSIRISSSESVSALRCAIMENNRNSPHFRDLDLFHLTLYKISLPCGKDDALENDLGARTLSSLGKYLFTPRKLSDTFMPPPADNQLHLVVTGWAVLECWVRGANIVSSFPVETSPHTFVDQLEDAIKAAYNKHFNTKLHSVFTRLYKIPIGDDVELQEILNTPGSGEHLRVWSSNRVMDIFGDVPFSRMPRVVLEPLDAGSNCDLLALQRRQSIPRRCEFTHCGRLREYEDTICTTLLHPVFGQFIDDCQTIQVTAVDNRLVEGLANTMSASHNSEIERVKAVVKQFQTHNIYFGTICETKTGYVTDALDVTVDGYHYIIAEFTNEARYMPTEPYFQALGYYVELTAKSAVKFGRFANMPCFLLSVFGPYIVFAGVAWNLRPTIQAFSTPIKFHFHSTDIDSRHTAARHVAALRKVTEGLRRYYETLRGPLPTVAPRLPHLFPYPTSYKSLDDNTKEKHFQYVDDPDPRKLFFFGTQDDDDDICIKFVRTYSSEAHKCLASLGCAPALRGFEKIGGGWFMVVMDRLAPVDWETLSTRRKPHPVSLFADISAKLRLFHEAGYVHGKISEKNIMLCTFDERRFMITGLDWAGRSGEVHYPIDVNCRDTVTPPGACDGGVILAEDDLLMLKHII